MTMTTLPPLPDWQANAHQLHHAAQILGALRLFVHKPMPNYLEMALRIDARGLSTDRLPAGGNVWLDWSQAAFVYQPHAGGEQTISLLNQSQATALEALLARMDGCGEPLVHAEPQADLPYLRALRTAYAVRGLDLALLPVEGSGPSTELLTVDSAVSAAYGEALDRVFTAMARFRAQLYGAMTPVVVWPEHFDASFLWFATEHATDDDPQLNFGFAPFSEGIDQPYLYAYAYPSPANMTELPLPSPARWHMEGWNGAMVPYAALRELTDPEHAIASLLEAIYATLAPALLRQDS